MNCRICGRPVELHPSAQERARKTGLPASFYTRLFTTHTSCELERREECVRAAMAAARARYDASRVVASTFTVILK